MRTPRDLSIYGFGKKGQDMRNMMLHCVVLPQYLVQSALGTSGASSSAEGGRRSLPGGTRSLSGAFCAGGVIPNWSMTDEPDAFSAAKIVSVIDVMMKPIASTHVILPRAVAAERPELAPPPPPPMPRPPPSERCISTTAIKPKARNRWMIRTTFSYCMGRYWPFAARWAVSMQKRFDPQVVFRANQ